jgi:hypothetical protein
VHDAGHVCTALALIGGSQRPRPSGSQSGYPVEQGNLTVKVTAVRSQSATSAPGGFRGTFRLQGRSHVGYPAGEGNLTVRLP